MTINIQQEIATLNDQFDLQLTSLDDSELNEDERGVYCYKTIQIIFNDKGGHIQYNPNGLFLMANQYKTNGGFLNGLKKLKTLLK